MRKANRPQLLRRQMRPSSGISAGETNFALNASVNIVPTSTLPTWQSALASTAALDGPGRLDSRGTPARACAG